MEASATKALKIGLGIRGIIAALILGIICLYQPIFGNTDSFMWAQILLLLASVVYVAFSIIWDKKYIQLTNLQLLAAVVLLGATLVTENILFVAIGLFAHAMWDLWHLATEKRYVPWWYAGACIYVDLAAVALIIMNRA
jgi:hypothetical protein